MGGNNNGVNSIISPDSSVDGTPPDNPAQLLSQPNETDTNPDSPLSQHLYPEDTIDLIRKDVREALDRFTGA